MTDLPTSDRKDMNMKPCENTQNDLLLGLDGTALPKSAATHLATCSACQAFQQSLKLADEAGGTLNEPPATVDQAILSYARKQSKNGSGKALNFSLIIRYAVAASLVALLSLAAWQAFNPPAPTGPEERFITDGTAAKPNGWQDEELNTALGEMVATADSADQMEDDQVDILFADESTEAVADIIESQLAEIQAELYFAALTFE